MCDSHETKADNKEIANIIGTFTFPFPVNQFGSLFYRAMLQLKEKSLKYNEGKINAIPELSEDTLHEISW